MDTFPNQMKFITNTSWMVDAFGSSLGNLMIQSASGMDSMIINRIDDTEKILRGLENKLDVEWQYSTEFRNFKGENTKISQKMQTQILNGHYTFPTKFFNTHTILAFNPMRSSFSKTIKIFLEILAEVDIAADYATKRTLFMPFGGDFKFKNAASRYQQIDLLVILIQSNNSEKGPMPKAEAQYTNVKDYFRDVQAVSQSTDKKKGNSDFFPYTNRYLSKSLTGGVWTGYYTTRPWYKRFYQEYSRKVRLLKALAPLQTSARDISKEGKFFQKMDAATW